MRTRRRGAEPKVATRGDRVERTFMFTDVVKSTDIRSAYIESLGEAQGNERFRADVLLPHNERIEECIRTSRGQIVGIAGDSYFVVFDDAGSCRNAHGVGNPAAR